MRISDWSSYVCSSDLSGANTEAEAFAVEQELKEKGGGSLELSYKWPARISAESDLAAQLEQHRIRIFEETRSDWEASVADCPQEAVTCRSFSYANAYEVIADLPRFLSLSNSFSPYTGWAHGSYGRGARKSVV